MAEQELEEYEFDDVESRGFESALDESDGSSGFEEPANGDLDDLEYLSLDLANLLPTESLLRLLELLRAREGKAMELSRENEELRREVSQLRQKVSVARGRRRSEEALQSPRQPVEEQPPRDPHLMTLQADLERRVASFVAERRGESRHRDPLSEDLQEAAAETLDFLEDAERVAEELPRLLAMLTQWLVWSSREDLAPRGASSLLSRVPEGPLRHAYSRALTRAEECSGLPGDASAFAELPPCAPHAMQAIEAESSSAHGQRVGLASLALATFAAEGRGAVLQENGRGWTVTLQAARSRPYHPEVQTWALAVMANCALELPRDSDGADLAWQGVAACAAAVRAIPNSADVLERAAHALAALLAAHPRRAGAAARAKGLLTMLREAALAFPPSVEANSGLHRRLAEAANALQRAEAAAGGVAQSNWLSPTGERDCDRRRSARQSFVA